MNVLLTGGAEHTAPGLMAMRQALIISGFNVLTVVPETESEHVACSISPNVAISIVQVGGDDKNPIYQVDGTPVDCVRIAMLSGLARDVSVVVSGIYGQLCLGEQSLYSGTSAAAREATSLGYPSLAVFQQVIEGASVGFDWCSTVAAEIAAWLGASSPPMCCAISINVPAILQSRSLKLTQPALRVWDPAELGQSTVDEVTGRVTFIRSALQAPQFEMQTNTDATAVATGHASVTQLECDVVNSTEHPVRERLEEVIKNVNVRIGATPQACQSGCCG
ncbi:5'/3'-nucleotidase SurE [Pseudomonas sp. Teo4]|uniref:5'/3'-nucleotidase SurE n=1 Tax=Pseudomonas sp. Teo4 TaxID=3064528 RepID=UPI002ABA4862|nr:5'/3'-nucleotidase SurE [Pseudomonas sp. Teo4]MDZ3992566.1 5'-nucleotidase SurE [Pseudomonas sp. Teo4]